MSQIYYKAHNSPHMVQGVGRGISRGLLGLIIFISLGLLLLTQ